MQILSCDTGRSHMVQNRAIKKDGNMMMYLARNMFKECVAVTENILLVEH